MTRDAYLDMCEQLGTNADDGILPIEYHELSNHTQDALSIFEYLQDNWDNMNGTYLGKDLSNIAFILELLHIEKSNWLIIYILLIRIINYRVKSINRRISNKAKVNKK